MKMIRNLFPVVTLQATIDDYETANDRLIAELNKIFEKDEIKRVLSYKWNDVLLTKEKHKLGYTSFMEESLTEKPEFKFFYDQIGMLIEEFFEQLGYNGPWHYVNSWASVYPKGAYVPLHDHKPLHWSAAYYVKAPPGCGDILFTDPKEYALQNEPEGTNFRGCFQHRVTPEPGMILVFPSYLKHETYPNESDEDRIIISFNILCEDKKQ